MTSTTGGTGGLANYRLPELFGWRIVGPWYTVVIVLLFLALSVMVGIRGGLLPWA